ncbi:Hpt domain-containing protein [Hyphococcus sp. DH-69]|uniref:Hpt domain-containing protein n=1 Tax=Hyphococcus formosus TaxID=3143534 RepID=UPI00398B57B7
MTKQLIDMEHLEKYVSGDVALRDEILGIFAEQIRSLLAQFDVDLEDENWKNTAHTLKGASRGVGSWEIGNLCEQAEALIGNVRAKHESRAAFLVTLRHLVDATVQECNRLRTPVSA